MNELDLIIKCLIGALIGYIGWILRTSMIKINQILIDIAVIKSTIDNVKMDHEKIIELKFRVDKHDFDIGNAHNKIREYKNERAKKTRN